MAGFYFHYKKQPNEMVHKHRGFFFFFCITNIPNCKTTYPSSGNNNYNQGTRKTLSQLGHLNVTCSHQKEKRSQMKICCFYCVNCYSQSNADLITSACLLEVLLSLDNKNLRGSRWPQLLL